MCADFASGLRSLRIVSLRTLQRLALTIETRTLLLTGANGSGKTTLLEAVYVLARGRTFRSTKVGPLTTLGASCTRIDAIFQTPDYDRIRLRYVKDGATVSRAIQPPSASLYVKLIGENAQHLLDGEPNLRRRFLDWNVFQAAPQFATIHAEFTRVLMQRNAAIRAGGGQRSVWDRTFIELAEALDYQRCAFIQDWRARFLEYRTAYPFLNGAELHYRRGWPDNQELSDALVAVAEPELKRGYTLAGPSRADFRVTVGDERRGFSRGQTKLIVALLQLAAESVQQARGRTPAIWLLDDLEAELDRALAEQLWRTFEATPNPILATRVATTGDPGVFGDTPSLTLVHMPIVAARIN
ncbi:DNA replication and repair protein RecF [Allochromatium warmingii]|uniref:DNA replication and repair protein RecF n=1 Tax=Allochromatium warmingii TaxID=61595 RepID=A0A1H3H4Y5_ALLWA|nr:DNA replication and repair protein RecF [Allochromatium warmingii]SDY09824.1 DNA replication and repair protein RecF [Allochromatium warmingii]